MSFGKFPIRFGNYIILDRVSSGGMAEVYRAKAIGLENIERMVAIKRMLPAVTRNPQFIPMFIDEAKLVAQLNHPNIAQTYELGGSDDGLFIAMELVIGRDLNHVLKLCREQQIELPIAFAAYVASKSAEALDFAHRAVGYDGASINLVHRDVSPQNILLSYEGQVKLVDFGIAKADRRSTETQPGMLKGKLSYMSPEQALDGPIDRRTDIFCLGIVLWEMLAGRRLFDGENALIILERICKLPTPQLREVAPRVPEALAEAVHRCLARDPAERYQTADEVVDALAPFLIEDRIIFGERHAAALMRSLMPGDIDETQELLLRYRSVTEADCVQEHKVMSTEALLGKPVYPGTNEDATPLEPQVLPRLVDTGVTGATVQRDQRDASLRPTEDDFPSANTFIDQLALTDPTAPPQARATAAPRPTRSSRGALVAAFAVLALGAGAWLLWPRAPTAPAAPVAPVVVAAPAPPPPTPPVTAPATTVPEPVTPEPQQPEPENRAPSWGYVSVRADTPRPAKVFIDGKDIGYSPILAHRVRTGSHQLKVVVEDERAVSTVREIKVTAEHKRNKPLRLVVVPGS